MQTRSTIGPTDPLGPTLAALVALLVFMLCLTFETERIAAIGGFEVRSFGKPVLGELYAPWKSIEWMQRYDLQVSFAHGLQSGSPFFINPNEPAVFQAAFAAERARLPWEGGAALMLFAVLGALWTRREANSGLHGGACWATSSDLRRSTLTSNERGVVLGQTPDKRLLVHDGSEAVLAIGPPGSGKTNGIAKPTLLKGWIQSAIVFDPAAELAPATAPARARFTRVLVFDPRASNTARFNPLSGVGNALR